MSWAYQGLADALRARPEDLLVEWLRNYRRSRLRLPHPIDDDELCRWFAPLMESLTEALAPEPRPDGRIGKPADALVPGRGDTREVEKAAAFVGGRMAAEAVSGFDVAAVFTALRDTLLPVCVGEARAEVGAFMEWLTVLAVDAMASARERALQERNREELERGTPVVLVAPDVVAVFLIGRPDALALDSTLGRAMLRVARVGARAVILDLDGLADPRDQQVAQAVARFLQHRKIAGSVPVMLSGVDGEALDVWREVARVGETVTTVPSFEAGYELALEASEYRLVRRR